MRNQVVSHEDWLKARLDLLAAEKEFTRQRDALTRRRLGWSFPWVSSNGSDFNYDYHVSFTPAEREAGTACYNYEIQSDTGSDQPGISVFAKDDTGTVFHTYSCYTRGIDMVNGAYQFLDLVPKGRDEDALKFTMSWVRRNDQY